MQPVFLYGTLRHLPLLEKVLGHPPATRPAHLPDHSVAWAKGETYPLIVSGGAGIDGLLVDADANDLARLDFYEGAFDYETRPVTVDTAGGPVSARVYWPPASGVEPGAPFELSDWQRDRGDVTVIAAHEVMGAFGREDPRQVGARFPVIFARAQAQMHTAEWRRPRSVGRAIPHDSVKIVEDHFDFTGFFALQTLQLRHPRIDGGPEMEIRRTVFRAGEAATVLPYDPVRDRVLFVEQFRVAPFVQTDPDPWLLEPVAGIVDAGETPESTARREAEEEAGVVIGALHFIARYYPSPGATAQILHSYIGLTDLPDDLEGTGGLDHEGEDIAVHVVSFDRAMEMLSTGELANAPAILSLQWLAANRAGLRAPA
ncbi:NUDIX domain-containing protein [Rhodobacterales bacterium HKCCE3408]|nr:NUDIX domain-containing protein [Rhodobacterales bacterium HKCCE3408]